jgi:hypothetical protein
MNSLAIVLGVILIVIIMMSLFSKFFSGETTLVTKAHLLKGVEDIKNDNLTASANRTYSIMIYVNTWDNTKNKMIFGREGDVLLYLDASSATLKCKIAPSATDVTNADTTATAIANTIDITNNFPIQKWVYVTIVLDSVGITDFYLDGKLVKSVQNTSIGPSTALTSNLKYGMGHDTFISKFERATKILGPSDVWAKYMKNNGGSSIKDALGNYNVKMSILKDNEITSSITV